MTEPTAETLRIRAALTSHRRGVGNLLARCGETSPRLFGSVARGDARPDSDLDLLVDLVPGAGNEILRLAGLSEELGELLGIRVDVVAAPLLRDEVSATALEDAAAVRAAPTRRGWKTSAPRSPVESATGTISTLQRSGQWRTTPSCGTWRSSVRR